MGSSRLNNKKSTFDLKSEHKAELFVGSSFTINVGYCHQEGCRVYVKRVDTRNDDKGDEEPDDKP